ncbi:hypothetical protein EDD11_009756 [Mortierella claussenii]|nr:hypothetical protein EDD11_009756 [Mortierella claussenii]
MSCHYPFTAHILDKAGGSSRTAIPCPSQDKASSQGTDCTRAYNASAAMLHGLQDVNDEDSTLGCTTGLHEEE